MGLCIKKSQADKRLDRLFLTQKVKILHFMYRTHLKRLSRYLYDISHKVKLKKTSSILLQILGNIENEKNEMRVLNNKSEDSMMKCLWTTIMVKNMDVSLNFYTSVLNMEIDHQISGRSQQRNCILRFGRDKIRIDLQSGYSWKFHTRNMFQPDFRWVLLIK